MKYIKIIILVFLLAQASSQSKTIKFLVVNSATGAEIKPDSVVFENCTTHQRFMVMSDSLLLTEVETPTSSFTNSGADLKLKAKQVSNNLIIDIDNISADKVSIELYGYLGTSLYSQDISLFSGMNHSVIPLDFTNEKLLFLRVKSNNSIANVKLNRTAESSASEIRTVSKPVDEILGAFPIDTAFNYNIFVYKKGYRYPYNDYNNCYNISFKGIENYTIKLEEIPKNEMLINASFKVSGITLEGTNTIKTYYPNGDSNNTRRSDTVLISSDYQIKNNYLSGMSTACNIGYVNKIPPNYGDVIYAQIPGSKIATQEILAKFDFINCIMDQCSFTDCSEYHSAFNTVHDDESYKVKINTPIKYIFANNKYICRINKNEILELLNNHKLSFQKSIINISGHNANDYSSSSEILNKIINVADDAYIEIAFWE